MIKPWLLEIYADDELCSNAYAVYADGPADVIEEMIGTMEEPIFYLVEDYIKEWGDWYDNEDSGWKNKVAPHITEVTEKDLEDEDFSEWFNDLEVIYDER